MRLLFAKALDGARTAIVIDMGNQLLGGVAYMTAFKTEGSLSYHYFRSTLDMSFVWEWWKVVDSPDDFERAREWERPPAQIENRKLLR